MNGTEIVVGGNVYRTLEAQVYNNKERLDSLDIETLEGLPDAFEDLDTKVDGIDDRLVTAEGDISDIKGDVQDLDQDINGTGGIEDRLTVAEENIGTSAGDISQLQYDLGEAQGDITALGTSKLDAPTAAGNVGDVIVKAASGTEWQAVAPFNPNAEYPGVTAGKAIVAKNLEAVSENSGSLQDEPFFFQATATENNTTSTPTAPQFELKSLRGNTIVYNQLVDGVTSSYPTISGHVYWFRHDPLVSLVTSTGTNINVPTPQDDLLVDLTRWFNGSIPQAILDDPTIFPINYYNGELTYSAGELKNCSCTELKTVGFNQWDEEYTFTGLNLTTGQPASFNDRLTSKNYIRALPNTEYHFKSRSVVFYVLEYDAQKNYLGQIENGYGYLSNGNFTTRQNTCYIKFSAANNNYGMVYTNDICLNLHWDGERDGTYEPYTSHTYPMVWSGKSAGSAYDEKLPDGTEITKLYECDLGDCDFSYGAIDASHPYGYFAVSVPIGYPSRKNGMANIISSAYVQITGFSNDKAIFGNNGGSNFYIVDSAYTDATAIKTALAGQKVYYELETPTTSSGDAYTSVIEGDDYGTMEFDSVVPVGNEFFYPADYALLIDDLGNYVNYDVNDIVKWSDFPIPSTSGLADGTYSLKATISGGIATISWEAD